uniref:Histidine kinase n=1 Tax=Physcomitrium patens TaxID=3218 RepID=A0A2K1JXM9_PHYPA|nr:hypothetical protein PHYPA_013388 [Physcomitrium patens]
MDMNTEDVFEKMLGETKKMATSTPRNSNSNYGVSDHFSMEELPHPARNLTASRVVIMVTVAVLVGALTVSTWYFTHSYPKTAVTNLSESLRLEILVNTSELLNGIFKMNTYSSKALFHLMEKNFFGSDFGIQSLEKIRLATWSIFKAMPTITSLGVTALNGLTAVYARKESEYDGNLLIFSNSTNSENPMYYKEFVDENTGDPISEASRETELLPLHTYRWFTDAMKVPLTNLSWYIERHTINGHAFVLCSIPVQSHTTKEFAIIHSGHSSIAINNFLASLDLKGGRIFISDQLGTTLFSSDATACVPQNKTQCEQAPVQVDSILNEAKDFLDKEVGLKSLVENRTSFADVNIRNKRYSVDTWPYEFQALRLAVVIMIPRHSFWGPMDYYTRITWITLPLLSIGVVFIGCSLIYLLVEQVQAEEKLRAEIQRQSEAKRRAEASRDAKTNFLSSMSHELRTPMACIIGLLDMLLSEKLLDDIANSVRQIHRCATSLVAILNSALDIAKVESGKLVLEMAEFDLEAELTALIDVFSVQCDNKGLFICLQLADDVPKNVVGDSARVMQVFTNLIGNSIKFTSCGRISVRARLATPEDGVNPTSSRLQRRGFSSFSLETMFTDLRTSDEVIILFEVDDTGPGIEPTLRERVFENFVQGAASTTRTHGGTGLGLGIVKSLVQIMGGDIRIVEKEGQDCRAVAAHWVKTWGLVAHEVQTWKEVLIHMRALNGISVDTDVRTSNLTHRHHVDRVQPLIMDKDGIASNTPEPVKTALRSVRNSIAVRRPLHATRLKELLHQIASEMGDSLPTMDAERPKILSSNALAYAKQQEWDDPYRCDTEVSLPGVPKPEGTMSLPNISFDQATRKHPTLSLLTSGTQSQDASVSPRPKCTHRRTRTLNRKPEVPVGAVSKPFENLEILVAEDTPLLRRLAVVMLQKLGAITYEAGNGQEVVDAVQDRIDNSKSPFNCILMDCQMPVMDGYEACKAVRSIEQEQQQKTPIIALTANAMASDEHKCLHAGMDAFLTKPMNQDYMIEVILQTVASQITQNAPFNSKMLDVHSAKVSKEVFPHEPDLRVLAT